jgi:hypothetical protein
LELGSFPDTLVTVALRLTLDHGSGTQRSRVEDAHSVRTGGTFNVGGWVLTPNGGATIPASGVRVTIDGVVLPDTPAVFNRSDITSGFPGFNTTGAGRSLVVDTTRYADGLHTIGFLVTDSAGASDGVGGRFFRIDNSATSGLAASFRLKAETTGLK